MDVESGKKYVYENNLNIEEESVHLSGHKCYIFFSSNGLYSDKTFSEFESAIMIGNRYEWKSIATAVKKRKDVGKVIYVRDIYENYYIYGCSLSLSSIDKIMDYLKGITTGYEITTVGISSGGFMAAIAGCMLKVQRVFCISGQFDLTNRLPENDEKVFKRNNGKYFNIVDLVKSSRQTMIYYFCPVNCEDDYGNYVKVKDIEHVRSFLFPDAEHAATVYPFNFPDLIYLPNSKLDQLQEHYASRTINKNIFLLQTMTVSGFFEFLKRLVKSKMNMNHLRKVWDLKR